MAKYQNVIMRHFLENPSSSLTQKEIAALFGVDQCMTSNDVRLLTAAGYLKQDFERGPYHLADQEAARRFLEAAMAVTKGGTSKKPAAPKASSPSEATDRAFEALQDALEEEGVECGEAIEALSKALKAAREEQIKAALAEAERLAKKAALSAALKAAEGNDALKAALQAALDAMEPAAEAAPAEVEAAAE